MSQRVVHPLWRCCHWPLLGKGRLGCPWQGSSCDWPTCIFQPSPKTCRCECLEGPPAQSTLLSSAGKITIGAPAVLSTMVFRLAWAVKTLQRRPKYVARASVYCATVPYVYQKPDFHAAILTPLFTCTVFSYLLLVGSSWARDQFSTCTLLLHCIMLMC